MTFQLPDLPYAMDALAPHISEETLEYHYGKHHATYVSKLNELIEGGEHADSSLDEIVMAAEGGLFNNAAQVWNHSFYWQSMSPDGGGEPDGAIADAIGSAFGSYADFRNRFTEAAMTQFGSGWAWLVDDGSGLRVMQTSNADLPMRHSAKALLTIDVWEHAYYIDYRNARPDYVNTFMDHLVNWQHAAAMMG